MSVRGIIIHKIIGNVNRGAVLKRKSYFTTYKIVFIGVMAAIVCAVTFLRFPLLGSKVHFANAMCLLSGLLFGPMGGGLAAGIGSALYDGLFGEYDLIQCLITFASKFFMAYICAVIAYKRENRGRLLAGCFTGAVSYVLLYMLKTFVYQRFVYGYPMETVWVTMLSKLPASLINAAVSVIAAPMFYTALAPALRRAGLLKRIEE